MITNSLIYILQVTEKRRSTMQKLTHYYCKKKTLQISEHQERQCFCPFISTLMWWSNVAMPLIMKWFLISITFIGWCNTFTQKKHRRTKQCIDQKVLIKINQIKGYTFIMQKKSISFVNHTISCSYCNFYSS